MPEPEEVKEKLLELVRAAAQLTVSYSETLRIIYTTTIRTNDHGSKQSFCPYCDSEFTYTCQFVLFRDENATIHLEELACASCGLTYSIPGEW